MTDVMASSIEGLRSPMYGGPAPATDPEGIPGQIDDCWQCFKVANGLGPLTKLELTLLDAGLTGEQLDPPPATPRRRDPATR